MGTVEPVGVCSGVSSDRSSGEPPACREQKDNRQVAETLVISERTVGTHVEHVFNKLGVGSRVQVAAWAIQHGLLGAALA